MYKVILKFWILLIAFPIEQADFNQSLNRFLISSEFRVISKIYLLLFH